MSTFGHPEWARTHEPASSTSPAVSTLVQSGATCIATTVLDHLSYGFVVPPINPTYHFFYFISSSSSSSYFFVISASVAKISISEHLPTPLSPLVYQAAPLVVLLLLLLLISLISLWVKLLLISFHL